MPYMRKSITTLRLHVITSTWRKAKHIKLLPVDETISQVLIVSEV